MRSYEKCVFALLAGAMACHQEAAPPGAPTAAPSTNASGSSALPSISNACAALAAANDAVLAHPGGSCPGDEKDEASTRASLVQAPSKEPFLHYCHVGHGTWGVTLVSATLGISDGNVGGCGWSANYELTYQRDPAAPLATGVTSPLRTWDAFADEASAVSDVRVFDYNGDGRDELLLSSDTHATGVGTESKVEVLRGDGAHVVPYEVGFPYDGIVDADNDGRPDLLQGAFFHTEAGCSSGTHIVNGAPLLLHSLPNGTFSAADDVARSWALTQCPSATPKVDKDERCATHASCQRLWGATREEIRAWASASPSCDEDCIKADVAKDFSSPPLPFKSLNAAPPPPRLPHATMITPAPERD